MYMKAKILENAYEGLNAPFEVYLSKEYFCEIYPACVSSKFCEFIREGVKKNVNKRSG